MRPTTDDMNQSTPDTFSPTRDLARHAEAKEMLEQGRIDEGQELLRQLVMDGTQLPEVFCDLGALAFQLGDMASARNYMARAVELSPQSAIYRRYLAFIHGTEKNYDEALAALSPLLRSSAVDPEDIELLKQFLEGITKLTPITWARLLADLKTPTSNIKKIVDEHGSLSARLLELQAKNHELATQIEELKAELRQSSSTGDAWEQIHHLSDQEWQRVLIRSVEIPAYRGFPLPGFPDDTLQTLTVGSSNQSALVEGFNFYRAVTRILRQHGVRLERDTPLLDFGTGWGRYARIFMRDVHPDYITGVDVMEHMVSTCQATFPYARFEQVPSIPPSNLPGDTYQLIIAYSVFSHLSETAATAWIREFSRILAPGGVIAITTQGRRFLQTCEDMRKLERFDHPWHENLARSFTDKAACEAAYDRGEFLFSATGGGDALSSSFYGEALIPPKFVVQNWAQYLEPLEFIDDDQLPQALIVMRKPA